MLRLLPTLLIAACTSLGAAPALANDFPTSARVEFVTSCMNQGNPPIFNGQQR